MVNVSDLIPYARNARTHSDEQVTMIAGSIKEFGFNNPVLVDGALGIVAGHGRVLAARKLGMLTVPTIELSHLSDTQKRAYILADNKFMALFSNARSVIDPFCGTGTTLMAADESGRIGYGCELSPTYVDVAVLRWQAFTGKTATLNGKTFDEVAKERRAR